MQQIVPCIWFDHTALAAAEFYASIFPAGRVGEVQRYPTEDLPDFQKDMAGEVLTVGFEVAGFELCAINAGNEFPLNPSISFLVSFDPGREQDARDRLDATWARLTDGGTTLMPLGEYPFSRHYGWVADRYGVNWQLMLADPDGDQRPSITPALMFTGANQGRAEEAMGLYTSLFDGRIGTLARQPDTPDEVMLADFQLAGDWFSAMDSAGHDFTFNPGVSLMVRCHGQSEIDRLWKGLSAVPEAERCGWLADRYGVSWQIIPDNLGELMAAPHAYAKLMTMGKIDIAAFG